MRPFDLSRCTARRRSGKILVLFVLVTPVLLGLIGLVVDGGLLMAAQRQAQNAADAAALAAAMDKFQGGSDATALATAQSFLTGNGVSGVTLTLNGGANNTLNIPPKTPTSPYYNAANYVEVIVTRSVTTLFIQVLGVNPSQQVTARAVAGFEPVGAGEGVMVLDPNAAPGLDVSANSSSNSFVRLMVNGDITVNSQGGGVDQYGNPVPSSLNQDAVKTQTSTLSVASIVTTHLQVAGGVTNLDNIRAYDAAFPPNNYDPSNIDRPIMARAPIAPDPLQSLATPTTANGVVNTFPNYLGSGLWGTATTPQAVTIGNNDNVTFNPGIYQSIKITGGTAVFNPGIYILGIGLNGNGQNALAITGGRVTGNGVMFYNTGGAYNGGNWANNGWNPTTGGADPGDGGTPPPNNSPVNFGGISINGGGGGASVAFTPYNNGNNPFNGMLFYQRRWNNATAFIGGNASNTSLSGTLYAKWANFQLAGSGNFNAQFLVGTMSITGQATVIINAAGKNLGKANLVFLVE
jgi:Flp pilus assembly protein TadG